jgi:hypothetical protein
MWIEWYDGIDKFAGPTGTRETAKEILARWPDARISERIQEPSWAGA